MLLWNVYQEGGLVAQYHYTKNQRCLLDQMSNSMELYVFAHY